VTSLEDRPSKKDYKTNLGQFVWDSVGVVILWREIVVEVKDRVQLNLKPNLVNIYIQLFKKGIKLIFFHVQEYP
jgi:hypothetical protein